MTRDEILALPAGIALDTLVAEKVMGWSGSPKDCYWYEKPHFPVSLRFFDSESLMEVFSPSTDIDAAWKVVDALKKRGHNLEIMAYAYERTYATFGNDGIEGWAEANGENCTPLAICRAALLAVTEGEK